MQGEYAASEEEAEIAADLPDEVVEGVQDYLLLDLVPLLHREQADVGDVAPVVEVLVAELAVIHKPVCVSYKRAKKELKCL